MRMRKYGRLVAVAVAMSALLAAAFWPEASEVDVAVVIRGPMQVTIDEDAETRVRERFVLSAPVAGRLTRIALEPGDQVSRGVTVVARLTPAAAPLISPRTQAELTAAIAAATAAHGEARAQRERAAAALDRARASLQRQQLLAEAGAIARDDLEAVQTTMRSAEQALHAADFAVARAGNEVQLARARLSPSASGGPPVDIVAPVNGVVLRRFHQSEAVVAAGEPLVELGDPLSLEFVADLLSADAVRVASGDTVLVEQWGGEHALRARVRRVEPSGFAKVSALGIEERRVNVIIDLDDSGRAAGKLGDGYRVEIRIVEWETASTLKVPVGSAFRDGDDWAVFLVRDNRASLHRVQLGQRNDREAEVVGGLTEGDVVVMHPSDTLEDGARVTVRSNGP